MCDFSAYGGPSDEWLALAAQLPPPPATQRSVADLKLEINQQREQKAREAMQTPASTITMADHSITARDGVSLEARTYRPLEHNGHQQSTTTLPVYVHLHGGGFAFGTLASEDAICARIAVAAGVLVLNVNYRHTPEAVYPVAWHDAEDALDWLHRNMGSLGGDPARVVVGGISAGAQIMASLVLQKSLSQQQASTSSAYPPIAGQVLMIPCLVNVDCYQPQLARMQDPALSSYVENEFAPILPVTRIREFVDLLQFPENLDPSDLLLNPGNASVEQVRGLPPTVLGICGLDPLRDEGLLYGKLLTEAGVPTETYLFRGVPHGYRGFGEKLPIASAHWDRVLHEGIKWVLSNPRAKEEFVIHDLK
ncbi:Alpha/Beta hydrolase protein [Microdochium trichocladiopsis]|uniref:Alpha/Beta hydrolase protein n=1 Tax=Microdochium trichocladiopsis TaxID=1682393 RepID=A0A9P9BPX5_9PEZI|nr:Alpha/Beta hydrolase protein [Microdochium trichocladiopsis]KAH7029590.1 Alpha/Beta hydrolase protein [Microdochium trichocladiopsis]